MVFSKLINSKLKKTNFIQFSAKHIKKTLIPIDYEENYILNTNSKSFLGLMTLYLGNHIQTYYAPN